MTARHADPNPGGVLKRAARLLPRPVQSLLRRARLVVSAHIDRELIARAYLRGDGIEIGALDKPLQVPRHARVRYLDRMPVRQLATHYAEVGAHRMIEPDIIDNGETLASLADGTQDFVIANHFLEHCQNPIGALINMLRVLKPGGILYFAIPDKRVTFDVDRPLTPIAHLVRDFEEGPEWSRRGHFEEWVLLVRKTAPGQAEAEVRFLMDIDYSIHFHVWTHETMLQTLVQLRDRLPAFETELAVKTHDESVFVLRKQ